MSAPQSLRSAAACRYLEILSRQARQLDDDLEEYCRQFELCSSIASREYASSRVLSFMFLKGLPMDLHSNIVEIGYPDKTYYTTENFAQTFSTAKTEIAQLRGVYLTSISQARDVDRILQSLEMKNHPRADLAANAKFDRFYSMLVDSSDAILKHHLQRSKPEVEPKVPTTVTTGDQDNTSEKERLTPPQLSSAQSDSSTELGQLTPSTTSFGDSDCETDPGPTPTPKADANTRSTGDVESLEARIGNMIIDATKIATGRSVVTKRETSPLCEAVMAHVQLRLCKRRA